MCDVSIIPNLILFKIIKSYSPYRPFFYTHKPVYIENAALGGLTSRQICASDVIRFISPSVHHRAKA